MFERDAIHERGRALEDEFFRRVDQALLANLRETAEREKSREELAKITGFGNEALIDHLLDAGFQPSTLTALALVPCVFVAWADGTITPEERQAVIRAALNRGIEQQPPALQMVETWLHKHPPRQLWKVWKEYAEAVQSSVSPEMAKSLAKEISVQARSVAEASGGALGFGKVSAAERKVLDEIDGVLAEDA